MDCIISSKFPFPRSHSNHSGETFVALLGFMANILSAQANTAEFRLSSMMFCAVISAQCVTVRAVLPNNA